MKRRESRSGLNDIDTDSSGLWFEVAYGLGIAQTVSHYRFVSLVVPGGLGPGRVGCEFAATASWGVLNGHI